MKVSTQWLNEWVETRLSNDELANRLTMAGLEVDSIEPVSAPLNGVLVARVLSAESHPGADRLALCSVDTGSGEPSAVVCGAPNVRAGITVAYATPGAVLPDGRKIENAVIRDVASAGMLCSSAELNLADDSSGLLELPDDAPIGTLLADYLYLDDDIIDIDLTPNRGDCLSIVGVARDVAALTQASMRAIEVPDLTATIDATFDINIEAQAACPRYVGRVIRNVDASAPTPMWLSERLRRSGVRSISAVVDVTNYVMLELGQPMHGFDLETLEGGIVVRNSTLGESLELLDGETIELDDKTLVIADRKHPVALAGVMGGSKTGVQATTTQVFLESAYFDPITLAGVARKFRLHTDASHRFERGVDYTGQQRAIERASALILDICGGELGPVSVAESRESLPVRKPIIFRESEIARSLGFSMNAELVRSNFTALHCAVAESGENLAVEPPPFRFDLELEADLLEELARMHGYDEIPATLPSTRMTVSQTSERRDRDRIIRDVLIAQGYYEAVTYSFIDSAAAKIIAPTSVVHELQNPISSEMSVMRPSIWPGLIKAAIYNINRQVDDVRLFELGMVFEWLGENLEQRHVLSAIALGRSRPEQWGESPKNIDYYDIKQEFASTLERLAKVDIEWSRGTDPSLHPGQSADLYSRGVQIGRAGALHPRIAQHFGLDKTAFVFECDLDKLAVLPTPAYQPISKFPSVRRDISVVLDQDCPAAEVLNAVRGVGGESLKYLQLFDEYRGQGIDSDKKSLTIGLIFQASSSTLRDEEIEETMKRVLLQLHADFGGTLRE